MRTAFLLSALLAASFAGPAIAMDYTKTESWLCRPDANGPCDTDLSLTRFSPTGAEPVSAPPAANPAIDCFYVYPTVSSQTTGNANGQATPDEIYVVQQQFARLASVCRRFAPLYRQSTVASIWGKAKADPGLAYGDVKAAWAHYLANDNKGRGVLLFGHSQGSRHLMKLISEEIAGKPVERQIVAAWLIGIPVPVAASSQANLPPMLPPCQKATDTGCMVAYTSFAQDRPPADDNRFAGRPSDEVRLACVNPAALLGEKTVEAIFPSNPKPTGSSAITASMAPVRPATPSYAIKGQIEARCVETPRTNWLAVSSPAPRITEGFHQIDAGLPGWGLHLVDVNVALGTLLRLGEAQGAAWLSRNGSSR